MNLKMPATLRPSATAAPILDTQAIRLSERLDEALLDLAEEFGAQRRQYPVLIATEALERAEYPEAFPHLLMMASSLARPDAEKEHLLSGANLATPRWCLSPAVCLHVYAEWAGQQLDQPLLVTARGRCFRNEQQTAAGVRQIEFEMREIVILAEPEWLNETLRQMRSRLEEVARQFGLDGDWAVAEDPFFLPAAQGKSYLQRLQETKWEYQTACDERLALASINRHGSFFSERFNLGSPRREPLHTACIAMGLDRWRARCSSK